MVYNSNLFRVWDLLLLNVNGTYQIRSDYYKEMWEDSCSTSANDMSTGQILKTILGQYSCKFIIYLIINILTIKRGRPFF